ncbi:Hypothetical protein J6896_00004 [Nakaseomyces glabratus]
MNTYVSSRHQLQTVCSTLTYLYLDREDPLRTVSNFMFLLLSKVR